MYVFVRYLINNELIDIRRLEDKITILERYSGNLSLNSLNPVEK